MCRNNVIDSFLRKQLKFSSSQEAMSWDVAQFVDDSSTRLVCTKPKIQSPAPKLDTVAYACRPRPEEVEAKGSEGHRWLGREFKTQPGLG